jgi:hypothetical protein
MRRLSLCTAIAVAALFVAPGALADGGPVFASQGGAGVATHTHHPGFHFVALPDETGGTLLVTVSRSGEVWPWRRFAGSWGIPTIGYGAASGAGLSRDDRTLVLAPNDGPYAMPSEFLVVNLRQFKETRTIVLRGSFSFDALSPDASRMYLIEYASPGDVDHYIVRAYNLRTNRLLPGKIADRSELEKSMAGSPVTRTTSTDGRWVYTLYQKTSGGSFVHALDTVAGVAHCIDLPANAGIFKIVLSLRDHDRTLALNWRSGRPWLSIATGSWRVSRPNAGGGGGVPWPVAGAAIGGALALLAAGGLLFRRRRGEKIEQRARQDLGLA